MFALKTGTALTALILIATAPTAVYAGTIASSPVTTAGLRAHFDPAGNRIQNPASTTSDQSQTPLPSQPSRVPTVVQTPASAQQLSGESSSNSAKSSVRRTGKVVRLNGLFHASSRTSIGADGKLQGDCHVEQPISEKGVSAQ